MFLIGINIRYHAGRKVSIFFAPGPGNCYTILNYMAKYLITGGAGFIGSNIAEKILSQKNQVVVLDNLSTGKEENIKDFIGNPLFSFIKGDIRNKEDVKKAAEGVDFILHHAAEASVALSCEYPAENFDVNVTGTINVLESARQNKIKKFVFAGSSSVYGNLNRPAKEIFPKNPLSPYALGKSFGEELCAFYSKNYKVPTVCLRYFNVFGPRQNPFSEYSAVIPKFINAFIQKQKPVIFGSGRQTRDFVFVEKVAEANLKAASSKFKSGEVFNIASGKSVSLLQLARILGQIFESDTKPEFQKARQGDLMHSSADVSRAKKMLALKLEGDFKEELKKTKEALMLRHSA